MPKSVFLHISQAAQVSAISTYLIVYIKICENTKPINFHNSIAYQNVVFNIM